mmetsp:Transcript_3592/g.8078  ORF Transcript_3592/g.8078 Transcript_3592/m.8078 type:complete len:210 (+) Transcript_3592:2366-2995(+)
MVGSVVCFVLAFIILLVLLVKQQHSLPQAQIGKYGVDAYSLCHINRFLLQRCLGTIANTIVCSGRVRRHCGTKSACEGKQPIRTLVILLFRARFQHCVTEPHDALERRRLKPRNALLRRHSRDCTRLGIPVTLLLAGSRLSPLNGRDEDREEVSLRGGIAQRQLRLYDHVSAVFHKTDGILVCGSAEGKLKAVPDLFAIVSVVVAVVTR